MPSIATLLEENRRELLDLSTRNRLLSMPTESKSARVVHVRDEKSDAVFHMLVGERKVMAFLPVQDARSTAPASPAAGGSHEPLPVLPAVSLADEHDTGERPALPLPPPEDHETDPASGELRRHVDTKLQTALTPEALQRRLLDLYRDAQLMLEEQGTNILYLALGRLKWYEADAADTPRYAPLVLVPVQLRRRSARERFSLSWDESEVQENLSLAAKLKTDFGLDLPKFPAGEEEELVPSHYAQALAAAVLAHPRWEVQPDTITLGFFSFAKFLMYRDLDVRTWPDAAKLVEHPALTGLLRDGFPASDRPFAEDVNLDELIPAARLDHVVDADGSQTQAIEMVRRGRSVVIQGPPGTGKSQSITNLIVTAVLDGKKVLFVAEKLAALEVVKRRLEAAGLGVVCLELHSHKANKRAVLEEIGRTWELGRPRGEELESVVPRLEQTRGQLNEHAANLHAPLGPSGVTPFLLLGKLAQFAERGRELGELDLPGATGWNAEEVRERRSALGDLVQRASSMGILAEHPWRGAERETVLNIDLPRIREMLVALSTALPPMRAEADVLAGLLHQASPPDFSHVEALRRMAAHIAAAPALDREALCHGVWHAGLGGLRDLVAHGHAYADLRLRLDGQVNDLAFDSDLGSVRMALAAHGKSFFRFLNGDYRRAMASLRGVLKGEPPRTHEERLALVDDLLAARKHLLTVRERIETGRQAFGGAWRGEGSDWNQLDAIVAWVEGEAEAAVTPDFRQTYGGLDQHTDYAASSASLGERLGLAWAAADALVHELALNLPVAFGSESLETVPLDALEVRLGQWEARLEDFTRWNTWFTRATRARAVDLGPIVDAMESSRLAPAAAPDVFERAYYSRLLRDAVKARPTLAHFDGVEHERVVEEFRRVDQGRLTLAKYRTLARHYEGLPPRNAGVGGTGVLLGELARKRGHRPVRKLLKDAGSVVQAIKPVFMMSPLSVAQFLEPGAVEFDLLVIDEASQVQPVDALGAFARARQHVVVGDNREFYEDKLFIVPSPYLAESGLGLRFHFVPGGTYDRGGSSTNRVEAKVVCQAIVEHARQHPKLSLGVAAFSVKQRQAILDELELLRREHPDIEGFFHAHPHEPFFVKNLENIQGDERDAIFISVGYGPDASGFLAMNFGPLSSEGGERRLNVLISRAKQRCEVFASLHANDIDLARAPGRGVRAFKTFLQFAETGRLGLAERTGREEDSPFEEAVRRAIESLGYEVHPQVGVAGFFVDLGIVDPAKPGRYLLGVECDGAAYHSSRSARDRDRLRQAVLEDHGWITRLLEEFPGGYFRYVDDLVVVCPKGQASAAIAKIEEAIRPFALNAEKSDTLTSEHWVEHCPWRAKQTVQEGSWEAFVASLKWFTALHQDKVGKLSDAFRQEGFNLPLAEYEFHARAADFGGKLRLWWHRNWKVLWRTARHTPESLVEEAVRLREHVRAKLDRLMDQNLPHSATLRKWRLQELKYYLGRSLYLEPFSAYKRLAQASEGVPELHETWSVAHAVATSDATAVVRASGRAASALAGLLRASGQRLSLAVENLGWGEAEIQAVAVLELYGVEVKFRASGAPSSAVERDPSRRLARGQEPLPGTHSFFDYVGELSALTGGRTADEHRCILFSRYSADENLAFDALALDRISGDEPGLGDLEPLGHY